MTYELRMPEIVAAKGRDEVRRTAVVETLFGQEMLETEKIKQKVREQT